MGKFIYIYSNNSICRGGSIRDDELFEDMKDLIFHSKEVSNKTIAREKKDSKFLHIFKKHTDVYSNYYSYYASYCI